MTQRPDARSDVLARIRDALRTPIPAAAIPRAYRTTTPADVDVVARFAERVADYRATVRRCTATQLAATIAAALGVAKDELEGTGEGVKLASLGEPASQSLVTEVEDWDQVGVAANPACRNRPNRVAHAGIIGYFRELL